MSLDLDADGRLLRFADRLAAVGGELVIDSAPENGARVSGTIPVRGDTAPPAVDLPVHATQSPLTTNNSVPDVR